MQRHIWCDCFVASSFALPEPKTLHKYTTISAYEPDFSPTSNKKSSRVFRLFLFPFSLSLLLVSLCPPMRMGWRKLICVSMYIVHVHVTLAQIIVLNIWFGLPVHTLYITVSQYISAFTLVSKLVSKWNWFFFFSHLDSNAIGILTNAIEIWNILCLHSMWHNGTRLLNWEF